MDDIASRVPRHKIGNLAVSSAAIDEAFSLTIVRVPVKKVTQLERKIPGSETPSSMLLHRNGSWEPPCLDVMTIKTARIKPTFHVVQHPAAPKSLSYDKY